ncbi:tetratricopeptide repeat protein [Bacillus aquiflavi]|uniref:tetratricopeptide repeat protein n=1 Tax=Bacillus aquiflavi TaxID=2672567 RepID=UPI00286814B7|nr:tetratricopeptide repeat protein [Bacillus aquiflavi]
MCFLCVHDQLGLEAEAVPFYTKALTCQLTSEERQLALLGLGSTYRVLGQYEQARIILEQGIEQFPHANEFRVFYALVLYNLNETKQAMSLLLKLLGETTNDNGMKAYKKAILFYSDHLDELWK